MKKIILLAGLMISTSLVYSQEINIDVQKKVLDNGVTVLVWERESAGRIGTRMFYKVDIAAERPGTVGLTHMLEHHLFKGSDLAGTKSWEREEEVARMVELLDRQITDEKNRNAPCFIQREVFAELESDCQTARLDSLQNALNQATEFQNSLAHTTWYDWAVQSAGGTNSTASTGRDWMKFDIDLPANKLELFMWTERSRIEHPVFRHFEPEKEVVVDQIRRYDNRPDGKFSRVMRSLTYDAHPYGWAHWFSDLTQATREDHWEIFYKYFIPQNTVIVVVGEVEAENVFQMAERYWGSWEKGRPSPRLRTVEPEPVGQKRLIVEAQAGPAVAINVPMPAVGHPDAHVFDILAELLGGPDGFLEQELIQTQNIATSAGASGWTSKYPSHFEIRVDARSNEFLDQIETEVNRVLNELADGGVEHNHIAAARSRLMMNLAGNLQEIGRSAVTIGAMESIYGWEHLNRLQLLWHEVTPNDITRVINKYFATNMQIVGHLLRDETESVTANFSKPEPEEIFGRFDAESLNKVRPGSWPLGGPVAEFYLDPVQRQPASAFTKQTDQAGYTEQLETETGKVPSAFDDLGETGIMPIAEQPWYSPPWMAVRRPSSFKEPMPADHYSKLEFEQVDFTPPNREDHRISLENGLQVFVAGSGLLPVVRVSVFIQTPVSAEPEGKQGLAELTARLLRSGTAMDKLNSLGASLQIQTDNNLTKISSVAPAKSADQLIDILGSMLSAPDFSTEFESERNRLAILSDRIADNAQPKVRNLFMKNLYGESHPFGRITDSESVNAILAEDIENWYLQYFYGRNMTIAISGDVTKEDLEPVLHSSGFAELPANSQNNVFASNFPGIPTLSGHQIFVEDIDTRQALVMIGHNGIEGLPEDHASLEVMHHILAGGGFISRMMELLRTQTGITSALYGEVEPGIGDQNPYLWRFGGNPDTILEGVKLAIEQIRLMKDKGVTEQEFLAARTAYIDGLIPASYDTPQKLAERLAHHELLGIYAYQSPQYLNYYAGAEAELEALRNLTLEDVNRAAKKYLDPDNLIIVIGGPEQQILQPVDTDLKDFLGL